MLVLVPSALSHSPLQFLHNWHPNLCTLPCHHSHCIYMSFSACFHMVLRVVAWILMALTITIIPLVSASTFAHVGCF